jgi:hypothetical protein
MAQVFRVPMQLDLVALSFIAIEYRSLWTIGLLCKTSSTRRKTLGEVWCNSWSLKTTVRNVLGIRLWFIVGNITLKQPIFAPGASRWNNILFRDIFFLFSWRSIFYLWSAGGLPELSTLYYDYSWYYYFYYCYYYYCCCCYRFSPSARCSTVANKVYQFMDIFSTKTISLEDLLCYAI